MFPLPSAARPTVDSDQPWPGLTAFEEADVAFFKGRDSEIEELLRSVRLSRLTVLFSRSGLGKTSLLKAGLFPRLREEDAQVLPVYLRLDWSSSSGIQPVEQVIGAVRSAAQAARVQPPVQETRLTLWEYFHRKNPEAHFWDSKNRLVLPLIVFDQFEEIFTHPDTPKARRWREEFLMQLSDFVEDRLPESVKSRLSEEPQEAEAYFYDRASYKVVLSLEERFLPDFEALRSRMSLIMRNRLRLLPMNGHSALEVACRPELMQQNVAEAVVRKVADRSDSPLEELVVQPALLSLFCRELNNSRMARGQPTITQDLVQRQSNRILEQFYEQCFHDLPRAAEVRRFVEDELVTQGGQRKPVPEAEAVSAHEVPEEAIGHLVKRRLIQKERRPDGVFLELSHSVLTNAVVNGFQERKVREAHQQARRNLIIAFGLLMLFVLTAVSFVYAWTARNQVRQSLVEAQEQRQQAIEAQKATQQAQAFSEIKKAEAEDALQVAEMREKQAELAKLEAQGKTQEAARLRGEIEELENTSSASVRSANDRIREAEGRVTGLEQRLRAAEVRRDEALSATEGLRSELREARASLNELESLMALDSDRINAARQRLDSFILSQMTDDLAEAAKVQIHTLEGQLSLGLTLHAAAALIERGKSVPENLHSALLLAVGPERTFSYGGRQVAFSPDGNSLATSGLLGSDVPSKLWDLSNGEWEAIFTDKNDRVHTLAFHPAGNLIAGGDNAGQLRIWDVDSSVATRTTRGHDSLVTSVAFSPDGSRVISSEMDGAVWIWDVETGRKRGALPGPGGEVYSVVYSPDGRRLASGASDGLAWLWDAATSTVEARLAVPGRVFAVGFDRSSSLLAAGGSDGLIRVWNLDTRTTVHQFSFSSGASVISLAFDPRGRWLAGGEAQGIASIWNVESGAAVFQLPSHKGSVESLTWDRRGQRVATTDSGGTIRVFQLDVEKLIRQGRLRQLQPLSPAHCREYFRMDPCPVLPN